MIRKMKFTMAAAAICLALAGADAAEKVVIKGSDTLGAKMVPQLREEFSVKNPDIIFEIAAEGSTTGITAIIDANADIGMSSREAKSTEKSKALANGVRMQEVVVGYDGIAVIVNEENPIQNMTRQQVERIFTGDVKDWVVLNGLPGTISSYTRNTSSGTYGSFRGLAMEGRDYATSSQKMAGNEQIATEVAGNLNGIGYVGLAYLETSGVKYVTVDGVPPTDPDYPYSRPLYYYLGNVIRPVVQQFIDFTLSPEGQEVVRKVHFIPIKANH